MWRKSKSGCCELSVDLKGRGSIRLAVSDAGLFVQMLKY